MTNTPTSAQIAEAIKSRLREAGVTHESAATALGMERATLNRSLNGRRPLKTTDLVGLAELLNTTVSELVAVRGDAA